MGSRQDLVADSSGQRNELRWYGEWAVSLVGLGEFFALRIMASLS